MSEEEGEGEEKEAPYSLMSREEFSWKEEDLLSKSTLEEEGRFGKSSVLPEVSFFFG